MRNARGALLSVLLVTSLASGEPSRDDLKRAGRAFKRGQKAYQLGNYTKAITKFQEAFELSEDPIILFNIAQSYRKQFEIDNDLQNLVQAQNLYNSLLRENPDTSLRGQTEQILAQIGAVIEEKRRDSALAETAGMAPTEAARRQLDSQAYELAWQTLGRALEQPNNPRDLLIEIYELRGVCAASWGKTDDAEMSFKKLLAIDPEHSLASGADASALAPLEQARAYWEGQEPPKIALELPGSANSGEVLELDASVPSDPLGMVKSIVVFVRGTTQRDFQFVSGTKIPGAVLQAPQVELYVAATDAYGGVITSAGSQTDPLTLKVIELEPRAFSAAGPVSGPDLAARDEAAVEESVWYKKWWIWAGVGAVVAGGVIAAAVVSGSGTKTVDTCTSGRCAEATAPLGLTVGN